MDDPSNDLVSCHYIPRSSNDLGNSGTTSFTTTSYLLQSLPSPPVHRVGFNLICLICKTLPILVRVCIRLRLDGASEYGEEVRRRGACVRTMVLWLEDGLGV